MENWKQKIKMCTGWSDAIITALHSEEEAQVYIHAGLVEKIVNGKSALVQQSIDPNYVMPEWWIREHGNNWQGWTNSDLMSEGYPPHDSNGDPYELHHIGQLTDSPLAELTYKQHHEDGNFAVLHSFDDYSDIERGKFNKEKADYWMARYKTL
jgi:hypothetical protein